MDKSAATPIHYSQLEEGSVYHFFSRSLGRCNLKYLGGDRFQVVAGFLQSQRDAKKKWNEGSELTLPTWDSGTFYQFHEPRDVAE